jgi:ribosomal protein S18 acetylase RimI-like enzyme
VTVQIRLATVDDVDAIVAFAAEVVPVHYSGILGETAAHSQLSWWTSERMRSAVEAEQVHLAVADEAIVGVAETGRMGQDHVVWKLYLAPEFRGRALGKDLLRQAIAPLRKKTDHVLVEHFAQNTRAARFYEREGWGVVRTEAPKSGDPRATVVWRRLELG